MAGLPQGCRQDEGDSESPQDNNPSEAFCAQLSIKSCLPVSVTLKNQRHRTQALPPRVVTESKEAFRIYQGDNLSPQMRHYH